MIVTSAHRQLEIALKTALYRFFGKVNVCGVDRVSFAEPRVIWENIADNDSPHLKTPRERAFCIHGGNWIDTHRQEADRALSRQRKRFGKSGQENDASAEKSNEADGISCFVQTFSEKLHAQGDNWHQDCRTETGE